MDKNHPTYQAILDIAEALFAQKGYASVTIREIGKAANMRHASLYYYIPDGKKQLFADVMERNFDKHHQGLLDAIHDAAADIASQMHAAAGWFLSQPPMDFAMIQQADIEPQVRNYLMGVMYDRLRLPIAAALQEAIQRGECAVEDVDVATMAFISLIQSIHFIPIGDKQVIAHKTMEMLLSGWRKR